MDKTECTGGGDAGLAAPSTGFQSPDEIGIL